MIKKVTPQVDFIAQEHTILKFWEEHQVFQKRVAANRGKPKWSFIDGPITANNPMGVHHAWGRTLKDIFQRYKAMTGHELRYQNGFDCQGLWVEIEVEKELNFTSKREVEAFGIEQFVNLCKERVKKYSAIQTEQSKRLGYWMDWDNSYYTMSDENNYTIWSFLKKLYAAGKIYRGTDVVPWSGRSGTSYSQMEIIEGRKLVAHKAVFVRFPLRGRDKEYLLVWTTTPWTLTSNVAAAVNVNLEYVKLRTPDGSLYYFAADNLHYPRLEKQFREKKQWIKGVPKLKPIDQIFKEHGGFTVEGTLPGSEMVGWAYDGPYDHLPAQRKPGGYPFVDPKLKAHGVTAVSGHKVIDGGKDSIGNDIVVAGEGTGIVHIAPGCGDVDHQIGKRLGLVNLAPLDEEARFIDQFGWLQGRSATDPQTAEAIIKDLKERDLLVHVEDYPHIYPHCWRSGDELVFRIVEEWYINMDWRDKIKKIVDDIRWIPEWGREREHEWLDNMGDWMISKKRFWGLALPIWIFEDGSFYVVGSKEELKTLAVEGWETFEGHSPHRPWIDEVKIRHPQTGLVGTRVPDVGNPWLDAGIVPYSTLKYNTDREYWKTWFPGDFVTESFPGQFRNWFYSLLAMSAFMEEQAPFKTLLGHALVKDETGRDMHKSWGNAIWFDDAAEKMGVDVMRWIYASQNIEHNLLFGYGPAEEVRKKLITFWNVYSFFATYAAVDGYVPTSPPNPDDRTLLDRWILSKLNLLVKNAREHYENYRVYRFMREWERFLDDLSNWYIRRNRRRFWKAADDRDKRAAYDTLYEVLLTTTKLLAPILPFVTEAMYQNLGVNSGIDLPESVHLNDFPEADEQVIDANLMDRVDTLRKVVELGRSARNKGNLKIRQPLATMYMHLADDDLARFVMDHREVVLDELNIKALERIDDPEKVLRSRIKPNLPLLGKKFREGLPAIREHLNQVDPRTLLKALQTQGQWQLTMGTKTLTLTLEDILVDTEPTEGHTSATDGRITVGLTTELTPSLVREGIVRDIIRHVQIMRKNANFAVEDRIKIHGQVRGEIAHALREFKDYFFNETLTVQMDEDMEQGDFTASFTVHNETLTFSIERVKL
ncbi:MAG: isoleucine--tRNA ligase [Fidelibacterota bacterium]